MTADDLERLFPGLAEKLAKPGELGSEDIKIESHENPVLLVRGVHVHSSRNPVVEGRRLAEAALGINPVGKNSGVNENGETSKDTSPVIVMGFGLGYAAEAAAELCPERPLIIIEKHPEILRAALEARNLEKLLSRNGVVFVLGAELAGVNAALSLFEKNEEKISPVWIKNRALVNLDSDWYAAVENRIKSHLSRNEVNRATLKRFGRRWVRNLSRNISAIRDTPGIGRLRGILAGKDGEGNLPVFLAAAGPGLDVCAPILNEIAERCVVVAVDTSLRFLSRRGTEADFVVSVDPQYWNFRHLDRLSSSKTRLVAESAVYPPCLRHPFGGVLLGASFFPLGRFIESRADPKGELGAGGSVATSAWDFARTLGARHVWIAGLDLSFPQLKTHFKGALFEDRSLAESGRFFPAETWNVKALRDGQPFPAASAAGGTVMTDKRLSLYAAWFENRFRQYPEVRNFSLSGEGLAIPGLELSSTEELLALPPRRREINAVLDEVYSALERDFFSPEACEKRAEKYGAALEALLNGLETIQKTAEKAASTAEKGRAKSKTAKPDRPEQEKILKTLDLANAAISGSEVKDVAGFLFPEIGEPGRGTGDSFLDYLDFTARFYRALEESAAYNLALLRSHHK